jgi:hypothetical protein
MWPGGAVVDDADPLEDWMSRTGSSDIRVQWRAQGRPVKLSNEGSLFEIRLAPSESAATLNTELTKSMNENGHRGSFQVDVEEPMEIDFSRTY